MWKWLRSWFVWRFSLVRLVVAMVFLGAFVGLNMRPVHSHLVDFSCSIDYRTWGWPLPITYDEYWDLSAREGLVEQDFPFEGLEPSSFEEHIPWTHQTYYLRDLDSFQWVYWGSQRWVQSDDTAYGIHILCAVINILLALVVFALILFLQIPRRAVVAKVLGCARANQSQVKRPPRALNDHQAALRGVVLPQHPLRYAHLCTRAESSPDALPWPTKSMIYYKAWIHLGILRGVRAWD
jgi:hypothetical protein